MLCVALVVRKYSNDKPAQLNPIRCCPCSSIVQECVNAQFWTLGESQRPEIGLNSGEHSISLIRVNWSAILNLCCVKWHNVDKWFASDWRAYFVHYYDPEFTHYKADIDTGWVYMQVEPQVSCSFDLGQGGLSQRLTLVCPPNSQFRSAPNPSDIRGSGLLYTLSDRGRSIHDNTLRCCSLFELSNYA